VLLNLLPFLSLNKQACSKSLLGKDEGQVKVSGYQTYLVPWISATVEDGATRDLHLYPIPVIWVVGAAEHTELGRRSQTEGK
jgi:hypothetical protein